MAYETEQPRELPPVLRGHKDFNGDGVELIRLIWDILSNPEDTVGAQDWRNLASYGGNVQINELLKSLMTGHAQEVKRFEQKLEDPPGLVDYMRAEVSRILDNLKEQTRNTGSVATRELVTAVL